MIFFPRSTPITTFRRTCTTRGACARGDIGHSLSNLVRAKLLGRTSDGGAEAGVPPFCREMRVYLTKLHYGRGYVA
jgi:hypothetical protein